MDFQPIPVDAPSAPKQTNVWALLAADNDKKTKLKFYPQPGGNVLVVFWCPGCQETHTYDVGTYIGEGEWGFMKGKPMRRDNWLFNGDLEFPSFSPSLKYEKCHLFVRCGIIEYCGDSKHRFSNKDIPMELF